MLENFRMTGDTKIKILFAILFITNILLFISQFRFFTIGKDIHVGLLHDVGTVITAIIILGFISTRLPKLKKVTDGSVYEIAYLILMGLFSLTLSYFNSSTNGESLWAPFIEMFRVLSVVLIFTFLATKSKSFTATVVGKISRKTQLWQLIIFTILAILASYLTLKVNGVPSNARGLVVMISALFAGPYVGIPVAIISGVWRYFLGGSTAFACSVTTILAGIIGSMVYMWNGRKFPSITRSAILMFLFSGFDMFLITVLTFDNSGMFYANALYAPMTFTGVLGIILFRIFLSEKEEMEKGNDDAGTKSQDSELILKLSDELDEYKSKVERLEKEMKKIKER